MYRGTPTDLTQIAREGDPVPSGSGDFAINSATDFAMNDLVVMVFSPALTGSVTTADNSGVYMSDGSTFMIELAREGEPAPDGNGFFSSVASDITTSNDAGQVVFFHALSGTSGGSSDNSGVFLSSGGTIQQMFRENQPVPGGGTISSFFT